MAECGCISDCPFYNGENDYRLKLGPMYKQLYCRSDQTHCARHRVFVKLGKEKVPEKLYPISVDQANDILDVA